MKSFILAVILISNLSFSNQTKELTLETKVKGITCVLDVKTIQNRLIKTEGINSCSVQKVGSVTSFKITYDDKKISKKEIQKIIEDTPGCKNHKEKPYKVKK